MKNNNIQKKVRTRIAPSPTGDPHIGTLYQSIFDYAFAKQNNGDFIFRIEDTDRERFIEGAEKNMIDALSWAGMPPDESPFKGGKYSPYRQSERLDIYKKYINELIDNKNAYYCFCSKERLASMREAQIKNKEQPKYDKYCLNLKKEEINKNLEDKKPYVIRLNVPDNTDIVFNDLIRGEIIINTKSIDDQILLKTDGYPTYHAAVVIDDHLMEITHIIRGEEWISSTPKHILIYKAFGWDIPYFAHLSLLRNRDKSKVSKRHNNTSINWYKEEGYLPEALINYLILLGWSSPDGKEIISMNEFIRNFSFDRVTKGGPIFDIDKLNWINGVYIRQLSILNLKKLITPYLKYKDIKNSYLENILKLTQDRIKKLSEINDLISFFIEDIDIPKDLIYEIFSKDDVNKIIKSIIQIIDEHGINEESEKIMREYAVNNNYKIGDFFMIIRLAITGRKASPPLIDTMSVLGREKVKERLLRLINN
jgi:glutamyl-tRNA synthetase